MIEVDRLMIEEYGIQLIQMMENAGRCLAILTRDRFFDGSVVGQRVVVLAGTGGNGGGALVAARRLHNWGANVVVVATGPKERFTPIPQHQYTILEQMGIEWLSIDELLTNLEVDAILDGIIGYSLKGNPRGVAAEMIGWANQQKAPTISLDTPSGLDLTSGRLFDPIIQADATVTLALPKVGLFKAEAKEKIGELYLGDISVPPELYARPTLDLGPQNPFTGSDIVRVY